MAVRRDAARLPLIVCLNMMAALSNGSTPPASRPWAERGTDWLRTNRHAVRSSTGRSGASQQPDHPCSGECDRDTGSYREDDHELESEFWARLRGHKIGHCRKSPAHSAQRDPPTCLMDPSSQRQPLKEPQRRPKECQRDSPWRPRGIRPACHYPREPVNLPVDDQRECPIRPAWLKDARDQRQ
jgi:hypothetical protein